MAVKREPIPDLSYALCFICKRRSMGMGYKPNSPHAKPKWFCEECISLGRKAYSMKKDILDAFESAARDDGGQAAGRYLDRIEKTDLAALSQDEWAEFLSQFLLAYEHSMREQVRSWAPPF